MTLTYYVGDILSGLIFGDLPFTGVVMDWALSGTGTFKGSLALRDPDVRAKGGLTLINEGQTTLFIDLDGAMIWAGIVWVSSYDSETGLLEVDGADFWSYVSRRIVPASIKVTGATQHSVIDSIMSWVLTGFPPAGLSTVYFTPTGSPTPPTIDFTYVYTDRKYASELLEGLAASTPGFDFRAEGYWAQPDQPAVNFVFGIPRLGLPVSSTAAYFDSPGNIVKYKDTRDASNLTTREYVRGTADGTAVLEVSYEDTSLYSRYPRLDRAEGIDEKSKTVLQQRGQYLYNLRKQVRKITELVVRPDNLTTYKVGDDVRVSITDERYPAGLDTTLRVAVKSYDVDAQEVTVTPWTDPTNG